MKKIISIRILLIILLILWTLFIFIMSAQPAVESSQTSSKFVLKIVDVIYRDFESFSKQQQLSITGIITFIVRKTAHFSEYFILGLLASGIAVTYKNKRRYLSYISAVLFSVIFAISDEVHQYFVPGRACKFLDICIDSLGCICAVVIMALIVGAHKRCKSGEINA